MLEEIGVGPANAGLPLQAQTLQPPAVVAGSGAGAAALSAGHPSPSLELQPEIGIVVIQFRDQSGKVELSIPSQQQLEAYAANPLKALETDGSTTA